MEIPKLGENLSEEQIKFLNTFSKACRHSILKMVFNAQSGHPGGSLSTIDYLALLYTFLIGQNGNRLVVSNGHISPAVYSTLAEMDYIPKEEVVEDFRKVGSIYEGHITRHVKGIDYGTGPLGIGVAVAAAFAKGEKMRGSDKKVFAIAGDGEAQEGEVYEMMHFAKNYNLNNYILFIDYNKVQLTASLKETFDIDIIKTFEAAGWHVIETNGHDFQDMWKALSEAHKQDKPVVIVGHTIMGQGIEFMEKEGEDHKSTWHGKSPSKDEVELVNNALQKLELNSEEKENINEFKKNNINWKPEKNLYPELLSSVEIDQGEPFIYAADVVTDCRSAYGKALLDLAKRNEKVIALTADLMGSVKTDGVYKELPDQYIEFGITEQSMVSSAGGFSLDGFIPFTSTFGAFMTSRAKDQARVNDINYTNVKMVATHCGLSVGEDGPTHQAIDDMGSMLGFFNTMVIEPADPNQTDRIIRYIASHYGNFYVRMGRHKFPVITKEDGTVFYDENYKYEYGKTDTIREGSDLTIIATGPLVNEALKAREAILKQKPAASVEIIAVSSIKKFDQNLLDSIKKTKKVITAEDHNPLSGLASQIALFTNQNGIQLERFENIAVQEYQLSGKADELYETGGISANHIRKKALEII